MPIIAKATDSRVFTPAPDGTHQAVCVDVIDLGIVEDSWQGKPKKVHKIAVGWQIPELRDDGKRFVVWKRYTLSLGERARLRADLQSWRGRPFTEQELAGFDVETVKGANCLINVAHVTRGEKTYANVVSVMPLIKGMTKIQADGYERRTEQSQQQHDPEPEPEPPAPLTDELTDDDIPFMWAVPFLLPALLTMHGVLA